MSTAAITTETLSPDAPSDPVTSSPWLEKLDIWAEYLGDKLNPILVKETRQALKSRQFVITFSVLLIASFGWTVAGSLSLMPLIYTTPSAPRMLIGYYIVLALPMLIVVPLAAYRSLESEIDDGTLELLSITALSAWQIVLGKLASASLQMMLYLVALFPCVAYAYTLRGVDLPTLALMMSTLIVTALTLTVVALSFAPLARGRTGRISTLLVVLGVLLLVAYLLSFAIISMITYGNPMSMQWTALLLISASILAVSVSHLLLTTTASMLTPESENRSSGIRWAILMLTTLVIAINAFAIEWMAGENEVLGVFFPSLLVMGMLWTLAGSMMAAESDVVTPRIQRELPGNFASRMLLVFFTPGPATGLVFACLGVITLLIASFVAIERMQDIGSVMRPRDFAILRHAILVYCSYLVVFLVLVRWIVAVVRINNHPRVEVGLAALIAIGVLSALVPYSIGLHYNDYRPYSYSAWQVTNWVWTLGTIFDNQLLSGVNEVAIAGLIIGFLIAIAGVGRRALAMRTATPEAVLTEKAKAV
ncbi:ABC transporter permease [Neorhodopirellula lusitana]|uniref:ABC transporter permease n=1 Tax=Neorhodopirellula lusitana TaxID=445327 RepID=UPI00384AFE83